MESETPAPDEQEGTGTPEEGAPETPPEEAPAEGEGGGEGSE